MLKEFKEFVMKGNVLDLAVAVIIGAAFGAIVHFARGRRRHASDRPPPSAKWTSRICSFL